MIKPLLISMALLASNGAYASETPDFTKSKACDDFTGYEFRKLRSKDTVDLCAFEGKPLLVVNTASNCGFTGQFDGLEKLHKAYADKGLVVLGFPSDDFFQEENDEKDTAEVCFINYGVTFTMMATGAVRGDDANPVFQHLGEQSGAPMWNFYKYLISADRKTIQQFNSRTKPMSEPMIAAIEKELDLK
ncbi:glutathione peroxidase [Pseudoalteromonas rubra]|uniref:Glutathione peroxidase n=1 Tax=Pseudoalteromonas rubra TaxID=43658 RepID=A0A8T0CAU9_9GAMM|nr:MULTISPECIES: glutathione peroxidase [Pseudoalteromonas]KAF7787789.1 glutathione peroxidase [Pseudoalteromonas rubra]